MRERERGKFFICKFKYRIDLCVLCALFYSIRFLIHIFWWQQVLSVLLPFYFAIQIKIENRFFLKKITTKEIKSIRKKAFSTSIDKNSEIEVRYVIYMLTFSNFKTWLNMASSSHVVAVVQRAREKKRNIHTWQTISNNSSVWEKERMEQN
jgi:hypothetical protein